MTETIRIVDEGIYKYRSYSIVGNGRISYVCIAPYGAFSPKAYDTIEEAMAAIDEDIASVRR